MVTGLEIPVLDMQKYDDDGFMYVRNLFNKDDISIILDEAKEVFAKQGDMFELFKTRPAVFANCGKTVQHLINLHKLSMSKRVIDLLHAIGLSFPVICTRPVLYFNHPLLASKPIYNSVPAHQDWRSMQGSSNACVIWAPLVDCATELGPLEVLPGSHKYGLRTETVENGFGMVKLTPDEEKAMVSVPCNAGDAIVFHSMLIHRSGNNISDQPRWSCHFRYNDVNDQQFIDRGFVHPYVYKPVEELL